MYFTKIYERSPSRSARFQGWGTKNAHMAKDALAILVSSCPPAPPGPAVSGAIRNGSVVSRPFVFLLLSPFSPLLPTMFGKTQKMVGMTKESAWR